jgi:hypothetical protein
MAEGGVLFSSESEVYFGVNPVGSIIWDLLPTVETFEELCAALSRRFTDVGLDRITRDVQSFLADLRANGLVVDVAPNDGQPAPPPGRTP